MIKVTNLTRRFGDFTAVNGVSFDIPSGQIVGLLGHNGAGKTTIMKMLTGYLEPSHGQIRIDDLDISKNPQIAKACIGYLPESQSLYPEMTVIDYLDFAAGLRGVTDKDKKEALMRVIQQTELADKALERISTLSRGYRQRVGVAQALLGAPKILILDEPTNGLDPSQTQHMRELICSLKEHVTIILSTHIMQEVKAMCDRVLIIRDGSLAIDKKLNELTQSGALQLVTNAEPEALKNNVAKLPQVADMHCVASAQDKFTYRIELAHDADADQLSSQIAKLLVASNLALYTLHPEQTDLESLFNAVIEEKGGLSHAA